MKKFLTNRVFLNTVILTLYTFGMEMYVRFLMSSTFQDFAVVRILLSSIIISLLWSWIWHFFKKVIQRVMNIIYIVAVSLYMFVEFNLYREDCRYADCMHNKEDIDSCAVKQEVGKKILKSRYDNYLKFIEKK